MARETITWKGTGNLEEIKNYLETTEGEIIDCYVRKSDRDVLVNFGGCSISEVMKQINQISSEEAEIYKAKIWVMPATETGKRKIRVFQGPSDAREMVSNYLKGLISYVGLEDTIEVRIDREIS